MRFIQHRIRLFGLGHHKTSLYLKPEDRTNEIFGSNSSHDTGIFPSMGQQANISILLFFLCSKR
jgi:hypothetical protein